ncbi:hypothetical protein V6N13_071514 [Hibiscus sabdariffa]
MVMRDDIVASSVKYVQELTAARPHLVFKVRASGVVQPQVAGWMLPRRGQPVGDIVFEEFTDLVHDVVTVIGAKPV